MRQSILTRVGMVFFALAILSGCDDVPFDIILRSSSRGTSSEFDYGIANIPDCIFEAGLSVFAEFTVERIETSGDITVIFQEAGYAQPPDANGLSYVLTVTGWPSGGQVNTITRIKVVKRGDEFCNLPFFPSDIKPGNPVYNGVYSDHGCCFYTDCCECFPHIEPPVKNRMHTEYISWRRNASPPPMGFWSTYDVRTQCICCTW